MYQQNQLFRSVQKPSVPPAKHGPQKSKAKKMDFKTLKKNTISSLNDVENFLNNFNKLSRYLKLYKILK